MSRVPVHSTVRAGAANRAHPVPAIPGPAAAHRAHAARPGPLPAAAGRTLDGALRGRFEPLLGFSLADVRIHHDGAAAAGAEARSARAYTVGRDIVFAPGQYRPDTPVGRWILAHELAHLAQARASAAPDRDSVVESDATAAATAMLRGQPASPRAHRDPAAEHRFGKPDHLPDLTFVSTAGEQPAMEDAMRYHRTWGLAPQRFDSMAALLRILAGDRGKISRLRIIAHGDVDAMQIPMFADDPYDVSRKALAAYAESDVAGLRYTLQAPLTPGQVTEQVLVDVRRGANSAVLVPFGLDDPRVRLTGPRAIRTRSAAWLIETYCDLLRLRKAKGKLTDQRKALINAVLMELIEAYALVKKQPPDGCGATSEQIGDLLDEIDRVWRVTAKYPKQPKTYIAAVKAATAGLRAGFRANLEAVRARLTPASWIDLRGCMTGKGRGFLAAVARFFGTGREVPHVSGPKMYHGWPELGYHIVNVAKVPALAHNRDVAAALGHWTVVTGVRQRLAWWLGSLRAALRQLAFVIALMPPELAGGLRPSVDPILDSLRRARSGVPPSGQRRRSRARRRMARGTGRARSLLVDAAQRLLSRYTAPDGELRYYLEIGLPLPVQKLHRMGAASLYILRGRGREAMNAWLSSQWEPAAPGLSALLSGEWTQPEARQVEVVCSGTLVSLSRRMYISPDPRYDAQIEKT